MSASRTLVRYEQIGRFEPTGTEPLDEGKFDKGRYFKANCLVSDVIGTFVYITGLAVSGVPQVTQVDIQTFGKYPAVGMIFEKPTTTLCTVIVFGEVDILSPTLIPGRPYFIGFDGLITNVPPAPGPGTYAAIQSIGTAIDDGRLLLNVHPMMFLRSG